jgi:AraC-like DNA-binding protein
VSPPAAPLGDDGGLMRAGMVRRLVAMLDRHGRGAVDGLLATTGLRRGELDDPDTLVNLRRCVELVEAAAALDPDIGLRYAGEMSWKDLGALGYVLLHSPTLGAAFGNLRRYITINQSRGGIELEVGARVSRVLRPTDPAFGDGLQVALLSLGLYTRLARDGLGEPGWTPRAVELRHPRPRAVASYQRFFGAPLSFGHGRDALVLATAELRRPFRTADADLLPILLRHADESLARMPAAGDLAAAVRRLVIDALTAGDATIERVADGLGLSARSLQRRLQETGVSYQALVDATRLDLARRYVADPALSLTETAFLLGYADLSAFSRAFRRWTGKSPQHFRRRDVS